MIKPNLDNLQKEVEKKAGKRARKKKPKMKVSGVGVKKLQNIIINKNKKQFI